MLIQTNSNDSSNSTQTLDCSIRISTGHISGEDYVVLDSFAYIKPIHDFNYRDYRDYIKSKFDHYKKWWDWFRTGSFQQSCKKKKIIKTKNKYNKKYWRKILPSKSGWVGKAMQRRKGL